MADQHEFGSPGWLRAACDVAVKRIRESGIDLSGIEYTFGEELTNVPERLRPSPTARVGWCVRVADGNVVATTEPPPPDADACNTSDWDAIEWAAHVITREDPERDAEVARRIQKLTAEGKLRMDVKRPHPPALDQALASLHNEFVAITAPRAQ